MTFVTSPGQTDPVRQLSRGPLVASTVHGQPFFNCSRATWVLVTRNLCIYKNSLLNSLMQWSPWPNYCSQTSIKQKTTRQDKTRQQKNCVAFAKAHSLRKGWTVEKWQKVDFSQSLQILKTACWNLHGPKIHPENSRVWWKKNHGLGLHPAWGCVLLGGVSTKCIHLQLNCCYPTFRGCSICGGLGLSFHWQESWRTGGTGKWIRTSHGSGADSLIQLDTSRLGLEAVLVEAVPSTTSSKLKVAISRVPPTDRLRRGLPDPKVFQEWLQTAMKDW